VLDNSGTEPFFFVTKYHLLYVSLFCGKVFIILYTIATITVYNTVVILDLRSTFLDIR